MDDDFFTALIVAGLSFLCWPLLIPVALILLVIGSISMTLLLGSLAVAVGGAALTLLVAVATVVGIILLTIIGLILSIFTGDKAERPPLPLAIFSLAVAGIISALIFFYYPVHPIKTPAEEVSYITVTDDSGEHIIDLAQNVELYMRDLTNLRMHRSFRRVTEADRKSHSATLMLHGADGKVLETFQMLDNTYFSILRSKNWESFKAYTVLGELHDYNEFVKIYEDNEMSHWMHEQYEKYDSAFAEFENSLSAEGTQLHFRIPVSEETDDFSVRVTEIYYKEPEPGKVNNRVVEKIYNDVPDDYWVEGQDYYLELAGKEYYDVSVYFGCGGVAKEYHVLKYMPDELRRSKTQKK